MLISHYSRSGAATVGINSSIMQTCGVMVKQEREVSTGGVKGHNLMLLPPLRSQAPRGAAVAGFVQRLKWREEKSEVVMICAYSRSLFFRCGFNLSTLTIKFTMAKVAGSGINLVSYSDLGLLKD